MAFVAHGAARADRIQAAWLSDEDKAGAEIWEKEQLVQQWELDAAMLGTLQAGMSMDHAYSVRLVREVGQARHIDYARRTFAACDSAFDQLQPDDFDAIRTSVKAYRINEQRMVVYKPPAQVTVASEVLFHLHHASRHLGMIEGLLGAQGVNGTASA